MLEVGSRHGVGRQAINHAPISPHGPLLLLLLEMLSLTVDQQGLEAIARGMGHEDRQGRNHKVGAHGEDQPRLVDTEEMVDHDSLEGRLLPNKTLVSIPSVTSRVAAAWPAVLHSRKSQQKTVSSRAVASCGTCRTAFMRVRQPRRLYQRASGRVSNRFIHVHGARSDAKLKNGIRIRVERIHAIARRIPSARANRVPRRCVPHNNAARPLEETARPPTKNFPALLQHRSYTDQPSAGHPLDDRTYTHTFSRSAVQVPQTHTLVLPISHTL